ncbi:MAG: response regulator [Deltaproteobacteria bacterium]|jgi:signal transduction histidine kinase|nr:response regulator [Deltaproteobacteria bacterium]MDA8308649.1 response regulator [Deltaproteobacteria bacterium]
MADRIRVLLVDDDQEDFLIISDMLLEAENSRFELDWVQTYEAGLEAISRQEHDVYLLDYFMGRHNGLEVLKTAAETGCKAPVIFLTGHGNYEVDLKAMEAGASDYLVKGQFTAPVLERSIRYSIKSKRIEEELKESKEELKLLASQLLRAQEDERKRIAREIHDSIGSSLSAVKFCIDNVAGRLNEDPDVRDVLLTLSRAMEQAIDESRRIIADLRPSMLDDLGIISTIRWFCREFESIYSGIGVQKDIRIEESQIPENLKIIIFRIIQEAMNNGVKHSKAGKISLRLSLENGSIVLCVSDNGIGFDPAAAASKRQGAGFGLSSMRERAELSGGKFEIESKRQAGTTVMACWAIGPLSRHKTL